MLVVIVDFLLSIPNHVINFYHGIRNFPFTKAGISTISFCWMTILFLLVLVNFRKIADSKNAENLFEFFSMRSSKQCLNDSFFEPWEEGLNDYPFGFDVSVVTISWVTFGSICVMLLFLLTLAVFFHCFANLERGDAIREHLKLQCKKFLAPCVIFVLFFWVFHGSLTNFADLLPQSFFYYSVGGGSTATPFRSCL